jgi:glycosyltransferase involved in cell wall biosynthesis
MHRPYPAALLLPGDAFDTKQHQVLGRRVAGRSFAEGLVQQLRATDELTLLVTAPEEQVLLRSLLEPHLPHGAQLRLRLGFPQEALLATGALHVPDPGLARWELLRSGLPAAAFSLTGVIHTICSQSVLESMERLVTAPLQPWDALVCTSTAGRAVVQTAMGHHHEALQRRFGVVLPQPSGPQLPLIPLAVADSLPPKGQSRQQLRQQARQQLGLPQEAFVVLFLGRLSFHSKAHPLVLYRAMARLAAAFPQALLLECGHIYNEPVAEAYAELAQSFPQLSQRRLGGLQPATEAEKTLALAAADVFVSPADNLQETFGLSVIEAMAAELPVVASNWDGYRDLVEEGSTGALIPTEMAFGSVAQLDGLDRLYRLGLLDYDTIVGLRSLQVVVNEDALVQILTSLYVDPDLRQRWGAAGRRRWQERFCWPVVAAQYRQLWEQLAELRSQSGPQAAEPSASAPTAHLFAGYATTTFQAQALRVPPLATPAAWLRRPMQRPFFSQLCGSAFDALIEHLERHGRVDRQDLSALGIDPAQQLNVLAALVKFGVAVPEASQQ